MTAATDTRRRKSSRGMEDPVNARGDFRAHPVPVVAKGCARQTNCRSSMSFTLHIVDAFTNRPFSGNPAAVCILSGPQDEAWMQLVAREMNLSETAFLHPVGDGFALRWFTPTVEVNLCGHATLASAHALWETGVLSPEQVAKFQTKSGQLECRRAGAWIEMNFPSQTVEPAEVPFALAEALDTMPVFAGHAGPNWLVEVVSDRTVRELRPNFRSLAELPVQGIIVTARSESSEFDFVSRYFAPAAGLNEDPVTGSAHCALGTYWHGKLGKSDFTAFQASARGGEVRVGVRDGRVLLGGQAVTTSRVELIGRQ